MEISQQRFVNGKNNACHCALCFAKVKKNREEREDVEHENDGRKRNYRFYSK